MAVACAANGAYQPNPLIDMQSRCRGASRARFSLLRRRHHCRACGRVACAACTAHRLEGQRACFLCVTQALQLPPPEPDAPSRAAQDARRGHNADTATRELPDDYRTFSSSALAPAPAGGNGADAGGVGHSMIARSDLVSSGFLFIYFFYSVIVCG